LSEVTERQLRNEVQQRMLGTDVFASVSRIRELAITVAGELQNPGVVRISGLSTLIDAIHLAGGIKKTGSLRNVQILRQGSTISVDLYDVVLGQSATPLPSLAEGDRLFVPVLGTTVAVAGQVKRPGIFELLPGQADIATAELLRMAGGELIRGQYRRAALRLRQNGTHDLADLPRSGGGRIQGGEILIIEPAGVATGGRVTLAGHVRAPGAQALGSARSVRTLVGGTGGLLPDPYLPFAVLEQTDPGTRATRFTKVDLRAALEGRSDYPLSGDDRLYVFGLRDIRFLTSFDVVEALNGRATAAARNCAGVQFLARWIRSNPRSEVAAGQFSAAVRDLAGAPQPCPELFNDVPDLLTFLIQNSVLVRGNVLNPGIYPVASRDSLDEVMAIARSLGGERRGDAVPARATEVQVASLDIEQALTGLADEGTPVIRASQAAQPLPGRNPWARTGTGGAAEIPSWTILEIEDPSVSLTGHVRYPGTRSLASARTLRDLVGDPGAFEQDPYLLFALIFRSNPVTQLREAVPFSPAKVIAGQANMPLQPRDVIRIFGFAEVRRILAVEPSRAERNPRPNRTEASSEHPHYRLMSDSAMQIVGEVLVPGSYPVAGSITLEEAFNVAGGLLPSADSGSVEVTRFPVDTGTRRQQAHRMLLDVRAVSPRAVMVSSGDSVLVSPLVSQRETGFVEVAGEVRRPGRYVVTRGEKLSTLIERAGGLQLTAYPAGAVFTRESVRRNEAEAAQRTVREFQRAVITRLVEPPRSAQQAALPPQQAEVVTSLLQRLAATEAVGRMVVEANPLILRQRPELDVTVEGGDRLVVPRIPSSIFVSGEVYNPGAQQFMPGRTVTDYVESAGGLTDDAERSNIFIVRPDGSARGVSSSAWGRTGEQLLPGSWVVVPRDLAPLRFLDLATSVTSILSGLAVSAASLAVISQY
ncbi:MAG TPA: SLBB domain-containing protein, partial [Thermomicrobiales bacterium]|nr:SLBB domain-containing protein [Thermomicrobiales bacterium]